MATLCLSPAPTTRPTMPPPVSSAPTHDARDLVGPSGLGQIVLDGQTYTLRITRAGKLILTK